MYIYLSLSLSLSIYIYIYIHMTNSYPPSHNLSAFEATPRTSARATRRSAAPSGTILYNILYTIYYILYYTYCTILGLFTTGAPTSAASTARRGQSPAP